MCLFAAREGDGGFSALALNGGVVQRRMGLADSPLIPITRSPRKPISSVTSTSDGQLNSVDSTDRIGMNEQNASSRRNIGLT